MTSDETVVLTRTEYDALIDRNEELEDRLAALDADDGSRVPHAVALAIMRGKSPVLAFRNHLGVTLRELSDRTGIAAISPAWWVLARSPGVAPVWVAFSTTIWPLTATTSMPDG